ncbi:MAG TPA: 8-oxo-dGTP diphosphatase [Patescibacteria group bacterium]|nr:8-oxo-dGTP diphosphatase [Patescibacteria group bacterium]
MLITDYLNQRGPIRTQTSLAFMLNKNQLLLALKKHGFGKGKWNGVGGKLLPGESIEQTATREMFEEIGVKPLKLKQVALFTFLYPFDPQSDQIVHVFVAESWEGKPVETEEMKPRWFDFTEIPFQQMWPDDSIWLPEVLKGNLVKATFLFDPDNLLNNHTLERVSQFSNS